MPDAKLQTAVLGLGPQGLTLLEAASQIEHVQICAVADRDTNLAEKTGAQYKCRAFDDYRQLIIQNQLDCLVVAAPLHSCDEHIRQAMKKKFNVLKLPPLARSFEEAAALVRLAEEQGVRFAVANTRRFAGSFLALREYLQAGRLESVFLVSVFCGIGDEPVVAWQSDPKLAGGGVLLRDCCEMLDSVLWNFALPQQVYAITTSQAQDKQQRLYVTEDTALVTMRFTDTLVGNLLASRRAVIGANRELLKLYCRDRILTVDDESFTIEDISGIDRKEYHGGTAVDLLRQSLENFALSILAPEQHKLAGSGKENLRTMAVIESAYLSARTGMPEEPARVLQMAQVEPMPISPAGNA